MARDPVDLDDRRSPDGRMATELRRDMHRARPADRVAGSVRERALHVQMLAGPAERWTEAEVKVRFLLDRFAETVEGQDDRMQKLIRRALHDIARLSKRQELIR